MTDTEQKKAAETFVKNWAGTDSNLRGNEKQDTQQVWTSLLQRRYALKKSEDEIELGKLKENKKERDSSIELVRTISMMMVVILHYNDGKAFLAVVPGTENWYILYFLESFSICAVDAFLLISAYFLSCNNQRKLSKVVELLIEITLLSEGSYVFFCFFGDSVFQWKEFLCNLIPHNYYVVLYVVVYLVSPYANMLIQTLKERNELNKWMLLVFMLFSIYPIFIDVFEEVVGKEIMGLSTVAAWGNQQGFTFINFMLVYFVGAYVRVNEPTIQKIKGSILAFAWMLDIVLIFIWAMLGENVVRHGLRSAWCYHNPLVILEAVLFFTTVKRVKIKSKLINTVGKATFMGYLIHAWILMGMPIQEYVSGSTWKMLLSIAGIEAVVIFAAVAAQAVYGKITEPIFNRTIRKIKALNGEN